MKNKKNTFWLIQGQESERKRIARELHDGLGQSLVAVRMILKNIDMQNLDSNDNKVKLKTSNQLILEIIQELRAILHNLSLSDLNKFGLDTALKQLIFKINSNAIGFKIDYFCDFNDLRFSHNIEIHIFRIIQEAIQNSIKHSNGSLITIKLVYYDERMEVSIKDNGIGFNLELLKDRTIRHYGITNIEERAKLLNSKLEIRTSENKGFQIIFKLKVKANPD